MSKLGGWNPDGGEERFKISPTWFCQSNRLNPCQAGIVRYLSRYRYEKSPWLLDQSILLAKLMLEFGPSHRSWVQKGRDFIVGDQKLGTRASYRLDTDRSAFIYCLANDIDYPLSSPLKLVCDEPTRAGLEKAIEQIEQLR